MKNKAALIAGMALFAGIVGIVGARESNNHNVETGKGQGEMSNSKKNIKTILDIFSAIERRDASRELELFQPDVELSWPPSLPYGGTARRGVKRERPGWNETWLPLQPTEVERKMDPRVIAASDDEVVVLWHQRGRSPGGDTLDVEVLGLYRFRDARLARAQMFYFDTAAVSGFLAKAASRPASSRQ